MTVCFVRALRIIDHMTSIPLESSDSSPSEPLLGALLLSRGLVTPADLDKALNFQAEFGGRLGSVLTRLGACSEEALLPVLAVQLKVVYEANAIAPDVDAVEAAIERTGLSVAWYAQTSVVPWIGGDGRLCLASRNPRQILVDELLAERGLIAEWHLLGTMAQDLWLTLLSDSTDSGDGEVHHLRELAEEAPVVSLLNNILTQAVEADASDIHLEPEGAALRVRYRVDGVLVEKMRTAGTRVEAVISRVKLMANLDIAERRLPQDGRISIFAAGTALDVRISTLPGAEGESVVMRLLPKDQKRLNLELLGLAPDLYASMKHVANQPYGLVLVTGPTGSGKSTTLYALLGELNNGELKLITVEDPVENKMPGIVQVQAHAEIGYDFARALRAILRQDPDVIMIGEIRDGETAKIAVQSSLTGHTVLSTLHTNDAISAFNRLIDMGVEPFLLASAVRGVLAQRLVRQVCPKCAKPAPLPAGLSEVYVQLQRRFTSLMTPVHRFKKASGCSACNHTGYRGRVGIYEWVDVSPVLAQLIGARAPLPELQAALPPNFRTLREDGLIKAWNGETALDEVFRVTGSLDVDDPEPTTTEAVPLGL